MIPNPYKGKLFAFEGIDGSGKTKQCENAFQWLTHLNSTWWLGISNPVLKLKEPNKDSEWGKKIYAELENPKGLHTTNPFDFQEWCAHDSKINLQTNVIPRLRSGWTVLLDRYRPSMCYGAKDSTEIPALMEMNEKIIGEDFIWPDLILIFDVTPETAIVRLQKKGAKLDEHEKFGIQKRVRNNYLRFSQMYKNCYIINGEFSEETVFKSVKSVLQEIFGFNQGNVQREKLDF